MEASNDNHKDFSLREDLLKTMQDPQVLTFEMRKFSHSKKEVTNEKESSNIWNHHSIGLSSNFDHSYKIQWTMESLTDMQNAHFLEDTLRKGVQYAKSAKLKDAETCYKSVLSVDPNHAECLVAYGALCANDLLRRDEALLYLQRAVDIDPDCPNAIGYLERVRDWKMNKIQKSNEGKTDSKPRYISASNKDMEDMDSGKMLTSCNDICDRKNPHSMEDTTKVKHLKKRDKEDNHKRSKSTKRRKKHKKSRRH